jgi:hypothetical protein
MRRCQAAGARRGTQGGAAPVVPLEVVQARGRQARVLRRVAHAPQVPQLGRLVLGVAQQVPPVACARACVLSGRAGPAAARAPSCLRTRVCLLRRADGQCATCAGPPGSDRQAPQDPTGCGRALGILLQAVRASPASCCAITGSDKHRTAGGAVAQRARPRALGAGAAPSGRRPAGGGGAHRASPGA